jgi:beta-mannosidase
MASVVIGIPPQQVCTAGTPPSRNTPSEQLQELAASSVLKIPTPQIALWWPNGYGNRTLYNLTVMLLDDDDSDSAISNNNGANSNRVSDLDAPDVADRRVGFRDAELVREKQGDGTTFFMRVNGVDIFAKGSTWVPADAFDPQVDKDSLRRLLISAAEVHQNMLRVWGGSNYGSEMFWEADVRRARTHRFPVWWWQRTLPLQWRVPGQRGA